LGGEGEGGGKKKGGGKGGGGKLFTFGGPRPRLGGAGKLPARRGRRCRGNGARELGAWPSTNMPREQLPGGGRLAPALQQVLGPEQDGGRVNTKRARMGGRPLPVVAARPWATPVPDRQFLRPRAVGRWRREECYAITEEGAGIRRWPPWGHRPPWDGARFTCSNGGQVARSRSYNSADLSRLPRASLAGGARKTKGRGAREVPGGSAQAPG